MEQIYQIYKKCLFYILLVVHNDLFGTVMRDLWNVYFTFLFLFDFGVTRHPVRISDFLCFFADWARVITIGATQPE